jgi:hypothetical protein
MESISLPKRFESFADNAKVYVGCALLGGFPLIVLICAAVQRQLMPLGCIMSLILAAFWLLVAGMQFADTTDLLTDETGLARTIRGSVIARTPWSGVKCIRESFRNSKNGAKIVVRVVPMIKTGLFLRLRREIVFSHEVYGFEDLLDTLNGKIAQHGICVEIKSAGIWRRSASLVAREPSQIN